MRQPLVQFLDGQRVHVGPQPDRAVAARPADGSHHAMAADPLGHLHPHLPQPGGDEGGGRFLVQGKARIGVQMASPASDGLGKRMIHVIVLP